MLALVLTGLATLALLQWAAVLRGRGRPAEELVCWTLESAPGVAVRASAPWDHQDRWGDMLHEDISFRSQRGGALGGASIGARLPASLAADAFIAMAPGQERTSRPIVVPVDILEQVDATLDRRPRPVAPMRDQDRGGEPTGSAVTLH